MAQTYPLDPLIRIVAEKDPIRNLDKVLVGIEVSSGKAFEKISVGGTTQLRNLGIRGLFAERKYVLVSNANDPRNEVEASVPGIQLRDFAKNWSLSLNVNYLVRCVQGNEVKVAEALWAGSHPGAVLHDSISRWVREFGGSDPASFIQNFYARQRELERYLEEKAEDELGLSLQATARIDGRIEPREQIQIGPLHIPVRVKGDTGDQDLKFEARLSVDPQRKMAAIIYREHESRLEDLLKTEIQKYCLSSLSLQSLYFSTPGKLEDDLTVYLNNVLLPYGRVLSFFAVQLTEKKTVTSLEDFFETKKEVTYEIEASTPPVTIKNHVQMSLQDYGLYKRTGSQNLESWIQENLEEIIHQVLFGKKYIDLLIGFDPLKEQIKQRLSVRASSIGYNIKQLITIPNLEQYEWLENFRLELEGSFETKVPRFPVRLGIVVVARIPHLLDVEFYLNRRQNVPDKMKDLILDQTRQTLHGIEPERFYMQFYYCDPEEGMSVERELSQVLTDSLKKDFNADVVSIVFKVLDTDMTDIWATLEKCEGNLEMSLPSFSDVEKVIYRATLRIEAIHAKGWNRFRTANRDTENIRVRLQDHIISQLGTFSNEDTVYYDYEGQKKAEAFIERVAKRFALEEFGLIIRLNSLRRDVTEIEDKEKMVIRERIKAIAELETLIIRETMAGAPIARIEDLEQRKVIIERGLPAGVKSTKASFIRTGELQAKTPSRLPELPTRKAIGSRSNSSNNGNKESE